MRTLLLLALAGCASTTIKPSPDLASAPGADLATPGGDLAQVTWTNFAQGFMQRYCNSCHNPTGQASPQDFSIYQVVVSYSPTIRCGTAPAGSVLVGCETSNVAAGQFPIGNGPQPSTDERLALVAWIDAENPR
jgi:hypothetical protein